MLFDTFCVDENENLNGNRDVDLIIFEIWIEETKYMAINGNSIPLLFMRGVF